MPKKKRKQSTRSRPHDARVADLRKRLAEWGAAAMLVSNDRDIRYLTGFVGEDSWALITTKPGKVTLISDSRFDEQIDREAPHCEKIIRDRGVRLSEALATLLNQRGIMSLGLQQDYLTVAAMKVLTEKCRFKLLEPVDDGLLKQRAVKQKDEVALIKRAIAIQQQAFRETIDWVKPGMTEFEIAAYLEYSMRKQGADGPAFTTIVGADGNAALAHYFPGTAKVKKGGILLIDWGAKVEGYCSDMTRVVAFGKMPAKLREVYKVVLEAQQTAIDMIKPGAGLKAVYQASYDVIDKAGYDKRFQHGLGHGIGLDVHESPNMGLTSEGELQEGQVVTVEPGIYLPGLGGVRIEDDVLVTAKGRQVLSDLPKSLDSAMI
jgi:Xaa-Pro aminopeptidase